MTCPTSEQLSAFHDGSLEPGRSRQIEQHAQTCAACAGELADLRRLSQWLSSGRAEPSPDAVRRVVEFADALADRTEAPTLGTLRRVGRVLTGLAASVLVFGVIRLTREPEPATNRAGVTVAAAASDWEEVMLRRTSAESATPEPAAFAEWVVSGLSDAPPQGSPQGGDSRR